MNLKKLDNYFKTNGLKYQDDYTDEGKYYIDEIGYYIEYIDNSYRLYLSIYHASEDNNAENVDAHTDEYEEAFGSITELYEEYPDVVKSLYKHYEDVI